MQRFMREKDLRRKRKLETKQAEYSKDSHTPCIIMKFPRLPQAQVGLLNNLESSSPSCDKQVGVGGFANVSSLLLSLSPRGRSGCPESFPLGIQMEKQARWACHLHKATEWDDGSSEIIGLTSSSEPHGQNQGPSGASRGRGWGWGVQVGERRQRLRLPWVPLENFATKTSSLVASCSAGVWCGGHPWLAGSTAIHPGPLLSTPGLAASFPCLHLLLTAETMHTASRNIFPEHCFYHAPPQIKNLQLWTSWTSPLSPIVMLCLTTWYFKKYFEFSSNTVKGRFLHKNLDL